VVTYYVQLAYNLQNTLILTKTLHFSQKLIYVFHVILKINIRYFHKQHVPILLYHGVGVYFICG
jgi:hypothetical protein